MTEEKWVKPLSSEEKVKAFMATLDGDPARRQSIRDEILKILSPSSMEAFGELTFGWRAAAHQREWIRVLEDPKNRHIAIVAPPGHGKSNWLIAYAAWTLGNNPGRHMAYVSSASQMANKPSVAIRDIIRFNANFRGIFPKCQPDFTKGWGEKEWFLQRPNLGDKDASMIATGVDGPILGARMDEVILDDICNQKNMSTKLQRAKVRDWVDQTLDSRLPKDGSGRLISLMTRWHVEDIMSLLETYEDFVCITMPALGYWESLQGIDLYDDTEGTALWEEFIPKKGLLAKRARSREVFERMYMGRPGIRGGKIFRDEWWRYYSALPLEQPDVIIQSWDTAMKEKDTNDWSVCETWFVYRHGIYLVDFWKGKVPFLRLVEQMITQRAKWKANHVLVEDRASGTPAIQTLRATLGMDFPVIPADPRGSKPARAVACTGLIEAGMVYIPDPMIADWSYDFVAVHSAYSGSDEDQDDEIDSTSQALWYIQNRPFLENDIRTLDSVRLFGIDLIPDIDNHSDDPFGGILTL